MTVLYGSMNCVVYVPTEVEGPELAYAIGTSVRSYKVT